MLGGFSCKGFYSSGQFKLVGGITKGNPDKEDLENAKKILGKPEKARGARKTI